jgi:prepilin-type processing-associated H-X9-DG protein
VELTTGILSRADYIHATERVVEFLRSAGVSEVLVAYGFGCDCLDDDLYQDVPMPLDRLLPFMAEGERLDYYRVSKDNLHVKDSTGRIEFLLCHESDIHFISEDAELVDRLKGMWLAAGFTGMHLKRADECFGFDVSSHTQGWPAGNPTPPCAINCANSKEVYAFHPSGANAVFADGSVHFLNANTSLPTLRALITINGGELVDAGF